MRVKHPLLPSVFPVSPGLLVCLGLLLVAFGCTKTEPSAAEKGAEQSAAKVPPKKFETGREVLEAMTAAYHRAKTYADKGTVRLTAQSGQQQIDQEMPFSVALMRPNKLRLEAYQIRLVIDGAKYYASIGGLPGQVVVKDAPAELQMKTVYSDLILTYALQNGFAGALWQLLFLLEDKPLERLLRNAEEPLLAEPGTLEGRACHRVHVRFPEGLFSFWIDQQSLLMRRLVLPSEPLRREIGREFGSTVDSISVIADFTGAQADPSLNPETFQFAVPQDAEVRKYFIPPSAELLDKKVPGFTFADLKDRRVTPRDLEGKVAVLDFWAKDNGHCRIDLSRLQKVYEKYPDSKNVVFFAVSIDEPQVTNAELERVVKEWNVRVPILRDQEYSAAAFGFSDIPARFLIAPDGTVQDYEMGIHPELETVLPQKIEKLLAGKKISEDCLKRFDYERKQVQKMQVKIAPRSRPRTFRLTPLWNCTGLQAPGNILVLKEPNAPPRLAVPIGVERTQAIAEIGADGTVAARHLLPLAPQEFIRNLRACTDAEGNRWNVAFASGQQRCHLLDKDWQLVLSFPADALKQGQGHSGIADVQLGDLDGDGTPEIYIGYWGLVGVHAVSLEGKRLWANRSVTIVARMAIGPADANGQRRLICTNNNDTLVALDAEGRRTGETVLPNRPLSFIIGADLSGSGAMQWCGLSTPKFGESVAVGLTLAGKELWDYAMPPGMLMQPVEKVVPGKIAPAGPGLWLLPGPDGSIHFLAPGGTLVDRFNYGAAIHGLATCEIDGRMVLVVATDDGLEAWKIEQ